MILPDRFQATRDTPKTLILYDQKLWPVTAQNAVAAMLNFMPLVRPEETSNEPDDPLMNAVLDKRKPAKTTSTGPKRFFGNLALTDVDSQSLFAIVSDVSILPQESFMTPAYVETLLSGRGPELPPWFKSGFLGLYSRLNFRGDMLVLRPMTWESIPKLSADTTGKTRLEGLLTLENFFERPPKEEGVDQELWTTQAELFIRWGIDPTGGKRADQFWAYVTRLCSEAANEKIFQECFDLSYGEVTRQLVAYAANARTARWKLARSMTSPPPVQLRDATPGEIDRIKGEWERLEIRYIRGKIPELEATYLAEARRTLHRAVDRGDQDPRLLTSLGLLELEADNRAVAREFLESAVKQAVVRPRAYFELARLRCEHLLARSTRDDGKLNAEQTSSVIELLWLATQQTPALPEVYELMAEVCLNSAVPPPPAALAAIDEGVKLFPKDRDLADLVVLLQSDNKNSTKSVNKSGPTLQDALNASMRDRLLEENKSRLSR